MKKIWFPLIGAAFLVLLLLDISIIFYTSQSSFCRSCHNRNEYTTLKKSPHKDLNCLQCHQEKGTIGLYKQKIGVLQMIISFIMGENKQPIKANVSNAICKRCHSERIKKVFSKNEIIVSHTEFLDKGAKCVDCHNTVAHGKKTTNPTYPHMDTCSKCHDGENTSAKCELCHESATAPFRKDKQPTEKTGPWAITHGEGWKDTHGMGNLKTCQICHGSQEPNFCKRCHQIDLPHGDDFPGIHGRLSFENPETCSRCHNKSFCKSCHKIDMPHPKDFIKDHADRTTKSGEKVCYNCHVPTDCDDCHVKHTHPGNVDPKYFKLKE